MQELTSQMSDSMAPYQSNMSTANYGISLSGLSAFDNSLSETFYHSPSFSLALSSIVLATTLMLSLGYLLLLFKTSSITSGLSNNTKEIIKGASLSNGQFDLQAYSNSTLCKIYKIGLVIFGTVMHIPMLDIMIRTIVTVQQQATYEDSNLHQHASDDHENEVILITIGMKALYYLICGIGIFKIVVIWYLYNRLFNLSVPSEQHVPWAAPQSQLSMISLITELLLIALNSVDKKYSIYITIILLGLFTIQTLFRFRFVTNYTWEVDYLEKARDLSICIIFYISIFCKLFNDYKSQYDFVYFLIFAPFSWLGLYYYEKIVKTKSIIQKIKDNQIKLEINCIQAMTFVINNLKECISNDQGFNKWMPSGMFDSMLREHKEKCIESSCICHSTEIFLKLVRLKLSCQQEIVPLNAFQRNRFSLFIRDLEHQQNITIKAHTEINGIGGSLIGQRTTKPVINPKIVVKCPNLMYDDPFDSENDIRLYNLDMRELKLKYLSELFSLFINDLSSKYPRSSNLQLLLYYFTLTFKKNSYLTIFQMTSFRFKRLSRLDQISYLTNEKYLLHHLLSFQSKDHQSNYYSMMLDGSILLRRNDLLTTFNTSLTALSLDVKHFWLSFNQSHKGGGVAVLNVQLTLQKSGEIAKGIRKCYQVFRELDDDQMVVKDPEVYYKFGMMQWKVLNDHSAYELYIGKMKNIIAMKNIHKTNKGDQNGSSGDDGRENYMVVNANGEHFGEVIQVSRDLARFLGWPLDYNSQQNKVTYHIEDLMPKMIRHKHKAFVDKFFHTGRSYVIGKCSLMFIKKSNGLIHPCELLLNFHYSTKYHYTFLARVTPLFHMTPFATTISMHNTQFSTNDLLYFIVENDQEGPVIEYSEGVRRLLQLGHNNQQQNDQDQEIQMRINDIIPNLDYAEFVRNRQTRMQHGQHYEQEQTLDLSQLRWDGKRQSLPVRVTIFEERYCQGMLDMNIVCAAFINLSPDTLPHITDGGVSTSSMQQLQKHYKPILAPQEGEQTTRVDIYREDQLQQMQKQEEESGSANSSCSSVKSASLTEFREINQLNDKQTPRSLALVIKLVLLLYFIMMTIGSVNLGINIVGQQASRLDVSTIKVAYDRLNLISMNQLLLRVILNIANGYEPEVSFVTSNRNEVYHKLQSQAIDDLKKAQDFLQAVPFKIVSPLFLEFMTTKSIPMHNLGDNNKNFDNPEYLQTGMQLYLDKLLEISSQFQKSRLQGNTQSQTLNSTYFGSNYRPTRDEKTIYFAAQNGARRLRRFIIDSCYFYIEDAQRHTDKSVKTSLITALFSIFSIIAIGLFIVPIMSRAESRRFRAIKLFLKVPHDKIEVMIRNCEDINKLIQNQYSVNKDGYQSEMEDSERGLQGGAVKRMESGGYYSSEQMSQEGGTNAAHCSTQRMNDSELSRPFQISTRTNKILKQGQQPIIKQLKRTTQPFNGACPSERSQPNSESDGPGDCSNENQDDSIANAKLENFERLKGNETLLNRIESKHRLFITTLTLGVITCLTSYFLISYFMSLQTFLTASSSYQSLELIFLKGACFDQTMGFLREDAIRNETLTARDMRLKVFKTSTPFLPSREEYFKYCAEKEEQYYKMRKDLPEYFQEIKEFLEQMESEEMCQIIYTGEFAHLYELCKTGVNGAFGKGLSNGFAYLFSIMLRHSLKFDKAGQDGKRNMAFLKGELADPFLIQMIDMKTIVLDPSINKLKVKSAESVNNYFIKLLNQFITAYIVFAVCLTVGVIALLISGIQRMKAKMLETNSVLRIIPFEMLPKEERDMIIKFFKE